MFNDLLPLDYRTMTRGGVDERRLIHNYYNLAPNEQLPQIPASLVRVAEASAFTFSTTFDSCEVRQTGGVRSYGDVRREVWGHRDAFPRIAAGGQ